MALKVSIRGIFSIVAAIALALVLWLQVHQLRQSRLVKEENERLREEVARLEFEVALSQIDTFLKVPTLALINDHELRAELRQIRSKYLEKHDSTDFVPLFGLYAHSPSSPSPHFFRFRDGFDRWKNSQDSFWEGYAINHADDGLQLLVGKLKSSDDFRNRLMSDTQLRDEYVKPLLMRFVRSCHQRARFAAIEAMLLIDGHTPDLIQVVRNDLRRLSSTRPKALKTGVVLDPDYARELADNYRRLVKEHDLRITEAKREQSVKPLTADS